LKEGKQRGTWEVMDDLSARQKIAHWFRHLRYKENLTTKGCDGSDSSEKSTRRKSSDDVSERPLSSLVSPEEGRGLNKRLASSVDPLDEIYFSYGMVSMDSILGSDEFHDDAP